MKKTILPLIIAIFALSSLDLFSQMSVVITDITETVCPNAGTVTVQATITGGTAPYTIVWTGATAIAGNNAQARVTIDPTICTVTPTTVNISVTDANSNTANDVMTFNVGDETAPVISGTLTARTLEGCDISYVPTAASIVDELVALGLTISDNCTSNANLKVSHVDTDDGTTCHITCTRTYTITDACGNASTAIQIFYIQDTTPPEIDGIINPTNMEGCSSTDAPPAATTIAELETLGVAVHDNCLSDNELILTLKTDSIGTCPKTITRTYTVTDGCNNSSSVTQTITLFDLTDPAITGEIEESTVEGCSIGYAPAATTTLAELAALGVTVSDNCTANVNLILESTETIEGICPIVITRIYTVTDECANVSEDIIQVINVDDTTAPIITGTIQDTNVEGCSLNDIPTAVSTVADLELFFLQISDNCSSDSDLTVTSTQTVTGTCPTTIERIYTITDACGNFSTITHNLSFDDNTVPAISGTTTPATNIDGCSETDAPEIITTAAELEALGVMIEDMCTADEDLQVTLTATSTAGTCPVIITRTYTVSDACNNVSSNITHTISIDDNTAPSIEGSLPETSIDGCTIADLTAAATSVAELEAIGLTISDNCTPDNDIVVSSTDEATGTCPIVVTRTYTLSDYCNNQSTITQIFGINDIESPVIAGSIDISTVEGCLAGYAAPAATTVAALEDLGVTITDNCTSDEELVVNSTETIEGSCPIVITRTYSVTDACGNVSESFEHVINVDDTTAPVITGTIDNTDIEGCSMDDIPPAVTDVANLELLGIEVSDECTLDENLIVSVEETVTGTCPTYIHRVYTVTDACENSSTITHDLSFDDTEAPVIAGTASTTTVEGCSEADAPETIKTIAGLEALGLTISDGCSSENNLIVSLISTSAAGSCPIAITRTYTVTDACGNVSNNITHIIHVDDTTSPIIRREFSEITVQGCSLDDLPAAVTSVAELEDMGIVVYDECTADENLTVTHSDAEAGECPIVVTRTYTITDECNNYSTIDQKINILDSTAPTITGSINEIAIAACPGNETLPEAPTTVTELELDFSLTISDNCTSLADLTLSVNDATVQDSCPKIIERTFSISDACSNTATIVERFLIQRDDFVMPDNESDTITCASELVEPTLPVVVDICDETLTPTGPVISDIPSCEGEVIYTYIYTDCEDHSHEWIFTYIISYEDFVMPENGSAVIACASEAVAPVLPEILDNCDNMITPSEPVISETPECEGDIVYTYSYTDCNGNSHDWTFTYTIEYEDFTMPDNLGSTIACLYELAEPELPEVTDNCGNILTPAAPVLSDTTDCTSAVTYTYTYTDCEGNTHDWVYTYTINPDPFTIDDEPGAITVECLNDVPDITTPAVYDACGTLITDVAITDTTDYPSPLICSGTRTITFTYTDCEGNTADWLYVITVTPPEFVIADIEDGATTVRCVYDIVVPTAFLPEIFDACGNPTTPQLASVINDPNPLECAGTRTYTYNYYNCTGDFDTWNFTYTVQPELIITEAPGTDTVSCFNEAVEPWDFIPDVVNSCNYQIIESIEITNIEETFYANGCEGERIYTFTYTDCGGNTIDWTYTYYILMPSFEIPDAPIIDTVECVSDVTFPTASLPVVYDACGTQIEDIVLLTTSLEPNPISCEGTAVYTYRYTDCAGNTADWTYTYIVDVPQFTLLAEDVTDTVNCLNQAIAPTTFPTEHDYCGNLITNIAVTDTIDNPNFYPCGGTRTFVCTYTDCAGNTADWFYTYIVNETDPFFIEDLPADTTVNCIADAIEPDNIPLVLDVCGDTITNISVTVSDTPSPLICEGTRIYTFTYADCAGNTADWTYTYTILLPEFVFDEPNGDSTINCYAKLFEPTTPVVYDFCGNLLSAQLDTIIDNPTNFSCEGLRTFYYTYTDCAGHTANWSYTINVVPGSLIVTAEPGAMTVTCIENIFDPTEEYLPEVLNSCGEVITDYTGPFVVNNPNPLICSGTRTYQYYFHECNGDSALWEYTFTIIPDLVIGEAPASDTISCFADLTEPWNKIPDVINSCNYQIIDSIYISAVDTIIAPNGCEGSVTYTFTYTDCAGNTADWSFTHVIHHDLFEIPDPPVIVTIDCKENIVVPSGHMLPTVNDICGNIIEDVMLWNVTSTPEVITCTGTIVYTFRYTDCAGAYADWTYTYIVQPPEFSLTNPTQTFTVNCIDDLYAPTNFPDEYDYCGNIITDIVITDTIDTPDPITCEGSRSYVCTYTDCAGNSAELYFTYTVDMPQFVINVPSGDSTANCYNDIFDPTEFTPAIYDSCDNLLTPELTSVTDNPANFVCNGTRTFTYTYTDCAGNTANWSYLISVSGDLEPFTIDIEDGSTTIACVAEATPLETFPVVFSSCGDTITDIVLTATVDNPTPLTCEGTRTQTYTFTDCGGNTDTWNFVYTIEALPFEITIPDSTATVNCFADAVALNNFPVILDNCGNIIPDENFVLTNTINDPDPLSCEGTRTFVYTVSDCAGNTDEWSYIITIDILPVVVEDEPGAITVPCLTDIPEITPPTVYDICGEEIPAIITGTIDTPNPLVCEGTRVLVYSYITCAGDTTDWTCTITVGPDSLTMSADPIVMNISCINEIFEPTEYLPEVYDACGNLVTEYTGPVITNNPNPLVCAGTRTYTYYYYNCTGYSAPWTFTFVITPELILNEGPGSDTVNCFSDAVEPWARIPNLVNSCGYQILDSVYISNVQDIFAPNGCEGERVYTFTYTDCAGNTVDWTFTYVIDIPQFEIPDAPTVVTVNCKEDITPPTPDMMPTVFDACGTEITDIMIWNVTNTPDPISCEGTTTYTVRYTDCASNFADWTYTYIVDVPQFTIATNNVEVSVDCITEAIAPTSFPEEYDFCGNLITSVAVTDTFDNPSPLTCEGTRTFVCTYTDCAENTAEWLYIYTINGVEQFTINEPDGETTVKCIADIIEPEIPIVYDLCGNEITSIDTAYTEEPVPLTCQGDRIYTYTYTDCSGNVADWTYTFHVVMPQFLFDEPDGDSLINCISEIFDPITIAPSVTDTCGNQLVPELVNIINTPEELTCEGTSVYNYVYTDCAGNTANWSYTFTIDVLPFTISAPTGTDTVACVDEIFDPVQYAPNVFNSCNDYITDIELTSVIDDPNPISCEGTRTYTYTYTDCAGNTDTWDFVYVIDIPELILSVNDGAATVNCIADAVAVTDFPEMFDYCDHVIDPANIVLTNTIDSPDPLTCEGTRTFVYTVSDCAGNTDEWNYVYTVNIPAFTINEPAGSITVACPADIYEPWDKIPTVVDACGNVIDSIYISNIVNMPNEITCEGYRRYTFTYTDCAGNTATWMFTFNVDRPAFVIEAEPGYTTVNCISELFNPVGFLPTVVDSCGQTLTYSSVTYIDTPNPIVCEGSRVFTYTFKDCAGNTATWNYTINIEIPPFTIPDPPIRETVTCVEEIYAPTIYMLPQVYNYCGDLLTNEHNVYNTAIIDSPNPITCNGTREYQYTFTDCTGRNSAVWSYFFDVVKPNPIELPFENEGETVHCLANAIAPALEDIPVLVLCGDTITDVALTDTIDTPNPIECVGTRAFVYTYTDCAGNTADWYYTYTLDLIPFTIEVEPGDTTVTCISETFEPWELLPQISDSCGNTITNIKLLSIVNTPNPITCDGTSVYTFEYTDCGGNTAEWTYTFHIERPDVWEVAPAGNTTVYCIGETFIPYAFLPEAPLDPCGEVITIQPTLARIVDDPTPLICEGTRTYVYTYPVDCDDPAGAEWSWSFTFNIDMPDLVIQNNHLEGAVSCVSQAVPPVNYLPQVSDYCGRNVYDVKLTSTVDSPNPLICNGTRTYTYTYTDCAGSTAEWSYTYIIGNLPPFVITIPDGDTTVNCVGDIYVPEDKIPTILDACGNAITVYYLSNVIDNPWPLTCSGSRTYVYTFVDCSNQTDTWSFTFHVQAPQFTIIEPFGNTVVDCLSQAIAPTNFLPTVYDWCGNQITDIELTEIIENPTPLVCNGTRTYRYTYTDCSGNTAVWEYAYFVRSVPALTLTLEDGETTVSCPGDVHEPIEFMPVAYDACGNLITDIELIDVRYDPDPIICNGTAIYSYRYHDCANHTADWNFTFNVELPPFVISATPGDTTVLCATELFGDTLVTANFLPVITTICGDVIDDFELLGTTDTPNPLTCSGTRVFTYGFSDCNGSQSSWTYTINVTPLPFVIEAENGLDTVSCIAELVEPLLLLPTAVSSCGDTITDIRLTSIIDSPNTLTCEGTRTYVYTYYDCAGNTDEWRYTYLIDMPEFIIAADPGEATVNCVADAVIPTAYLPTVTDACGNTIIPGAPTISELPDCEGDIVYTFTYTDCAGYSQDWTFTYHIDQPRFTITAPAGASTVNCVGDIFVPWDYLPEVTDACGKVITDIALTDTITVPDPLTCQGTLTYVFTYTDCAQNVANWSYVFTVDVPQFVIEPSIDTAFVSCVSDVHAPWEILPEITDACGNIITDITLVDSVSTPHSLTCEGTMRYNFRYQDCARNFATWSYVYVVDVPEFVITVPVFDSTVYCIDQIVDPGLEVAPSVVNYCGDTITNIVMTGYTDTPDPLTCEGTRVYTYLYTDCASNTAEWTYTYNMELPEFIIETEGIFDTVACISEVVEPEASVLPVISDFCGNIIDSIVLTAIDTIPSPIICEGSVSYTYTYYDCGGNSANWTYTYVISQEGFVIDAPAGETTVQCLSETFEPPLSYLPVVVDGCGDTLTNAVLTSIEDDPNPLTCDGTRTYTYSWANCAGYTAEWQYIFNIALPEVLVINAEPGRDTVDCVSDINEPTALIPVVTDVCGRNVAGMLYSIVDSPNPIVCNGTRVYTYRYTDCGNNVADWTYTYVIDLQTPPMVPPDGYAIVANIADADEPSIPDIIDACGNILVGTYEIIENPSPLVCQGTREYLYSFSDCAGNTSNWSFVYEIIPVPMTINILSVTHYCGPNYQGSIKVHAGGGSAPYTYRWHKDSGQIFNSSPTYYSTYTFTNLIPGTYTVSVLDVNGCEQPAEEQVVIEYNTGYVGADYVEMCDSDLPLIYGDSTFYQAGQYSVIYQMANECDSIINLTFEIHPTYSFSEEETICGQDLPYVWHGQSLHEAGTYIDSLYTVSRCDSIYTLTLNVIEELGAIGAIEGETECIFSSDAFEGIFTYTIDPVPGALYYDWEIHGAPWIIEHNHGTTCTLYVRTIGVGRLTVVAINECGVSDTSSIYMNAYTGIDDFTSLSASIHPNPASDLVNITFNNFEGETWVYVYDGSGRIFDKFNIFVTEDKRVYNYSVRDLNEGMYFINIRNKEISITEKLVIRR